MWENEIFVRVHTHFTDNWNDSSAY